MYCTINNIINDITYKTLCDLVNDENVNYEEINLNDDTVFGNRVTEQINNSKTEIDFYLNNKLIISENNIPPIINSIATDITIYNLYKRRFLSKIPQGVLNNYNKRIEQLKEIANGNVNIFNNTENENKYLINKTKQDRIFRY